MKVTPCCGNTEWDACGHGYICEACDEFFEEFAESYDDDDFLEEDIFFPDDDEGDFCPPDDGE